MCTLACAGFFCPALLFGYLMLELPSDTVPLFVAALVCSLEKKKRKKKFIYSIHRVYLRISSEHMCIYMYIWRCIACPHTRNMMYHTDSTYATHAMHIYIYIYVRFCIRCKYTYMYVAYIIHTQIMKEPFALRNVCSCISV